MYKVPLAVKNILLNCDSFRLTRPKYDETSKLKDLLKNTKADNTKFSKKNFFIKVWFNQPFHKNQTKPN